MTMTFPEFRSVRAGAGEQASHLAQITPVTLKMPRRFGVYRNIVKRLMDVTAIILAAPVVVPVVAGLAIGVAIQGGKPFYSQTRVGKNGRQFRMWKLRSMVVDADDRMEAYLDANPAARASIPARVLIVQRAGIGTLRPLVPHHAPGGVA